PAEEETLATYRCPIISVAGQSGEILGKWKLASYRTVFYNPDTTDYSCNHITYESKQGGRLAITSDVEDPHGHAAGDYSFELNENTASENGNIHYTLQIGEHSQWPAMIKPNE